MNRSPRHFCCHAALVAVLALRSLFVAAVAAPAPAAVMQAAAAGASVAAATPGLLLSVEAQPPGAAFTHAARRYLITYRSRGVHGEPIVASGYVLVPKTARPQGGWPVLVWAHGTTGVADTCAPSGVYPGGPEWGYHEAAGQALDPWLGQGYVVVAPDYEGLGTPGGHPYMNAASQQHVVVDAARAAHRLLPAGLSTDWLVMGHSQGGAAALAVAAHGKSDAPELHLLGAIAIAPGGYRYADIAQYALDHPRLDRDVAAFFPIVLLGAEAADPAIHLNRILGSGMQAWVNTARSRCLSELREMIREPLRQVFAPGADLGPLLRYMQDQSIETMTPTVPVALIQGDADLLVGAAGTRAYYRQICKAGSPAFYRNIPGGSHRQALQQSFALSRDFMAWLMGEARPEPCAPLP